MTRRYRARRDAIVRAVRRHFGSDASISGASGGLHVVLWLPRLDTRRVDALVATCAHRRVGVYSIAPHAVRPLARAGLMLGFGIVEQDEIPTGIASIAAAYREVVHSSPRRS